MKHLSTFLTTTTMSHNTSANPNTLFDGPSDLSSPLPAKRPHAEGAAGHFPADHTATATKLQSSALQGRCDGPSDLLSCVEDSAESTTATATGLHSLHLRIGNVTGDPGVLRRNPHPFPCKTAPVCAGAGFRRERVKGSLKPTGTESRTGLQRGFSIESKG